jgi:uncharacterized protein (DUF302 family)
MSALWFIAGILFGAVAMTFVCRVRVERAIARTVRSGYGLDESIARLREAADGEGWKFVAEHDFNRIAAGYGLELTRRTRVLEVCNLAYLSPAMAVDGRVSAIVPCRLSVWQDPNGTVFVSRIDAATIASLVTGGRVGAIGRAGSRESDRILAAIAA